MSSIGKRLMPRYLVKFLEEIYTGDKIVDFGRRMVSRKFINYVKGMYTLFGGKLPDDFGSRMVPEYLIKWIEEADFIEYIDDDLAYTKEVPDSALKYAFVLGLGGMSYKSENLIVSYEQGTYVDQTVTSRISSNLGSLPNTITFKSFDSNYQYIVQRFQKGTRVFIENVTNWSNSVQTITKNGIDDYVILVRNRINPSDPLPYTEEVYVMCVLGSTAPTEWKQGYSGIRDSAVTSLVSKDSSNNTIDTYNIPEAVQSLEGYGWGVNDDCYNYIDFENKKFIQNVGRVDLGSLTYEHTTSSDREIFRSLLPNGKGWQGNASIIVCLSDRYIPVSRESSWSNMNIAYSNSIVGDSNFAIVNNSFETAEDFETAMSGVYLYYELATPVETDISEYISDNIIEVSPSGSITFTNEYEQEVPSDISYIVPDEV